MDINSNSFKQENLYIYVTKYSSITEVIHQRLEDSVGIDYLLLLSIQRLFGGSPLSAAPSGCVFRTIFTRCCVLVYYSFY